MQRVIQYIWDTRSPSPSDIGPVWCLGCEYPSHADRWDEDFLKDALSRVWLTYRTGFTPISRDPNGPSPLSISAVLRGGSIDATAFTSDVGWGCMIRTGQCILANALTISKLGRSYTVAGDDLSDELNILELFADDPRAPFSIHNFVAHGSAHCGKLPGQWFGPSAVASCIRALTENMAEKLNLRVYVSDGMDVYKDQLNAKLKEGSPVLVLCGLRLGIANVNPVYYNGIRSLLTVKSAVGIAGGRTSASHYFYGFQEDRLLFHDPHEPQTALSLDTATSDYSTVHSDRLRELNLADMDPSMLVGFLINNTDELNDWEAQIMQLNPRERVIQIHDKTPPSPAMSSSTPEPDSELADGFVLCEPGSINAGDDDSTSSPLPHLQSPSMSQSSDAVFLNAQDTSMSQEHEEVVRAPRPTEEEDVVLAEGEFTAQSIP